MRRQTLLLKMLYLSTDINRHLIDRSFMLKNRTKNVCTKRVALNDYLGIKTQI